MEKFAGVGLKNIFIIWCACVILSVIAKTIFNLYPVPGLTQVINAGA